MSSTADPTSPDAIVSNVTPPTSTVTPTLLVALIFRTLDALRVFDIFYIMVGGQGNMATVAVYNQQQLIQFLDAGVGSATSMTILIFIMIFVVIYTRFSKTSFE